MLSHLARLVYGNNLTSVYAIGATIMQHIILIYLLGLLKFYSLVPPNPLILLIFHMILLVFQSLSLYHLRIQFHMPSLSGSFFIFSSIFLFSIFFTQYIAPLPTQTYTPVVGPISISVGLLASFAFGKNSISTQFSNPFSQTPVKDVPLAFKAFGSYCSILNADPFLYYKFLVYFLLLGFICIFYQLTQTYQFKTKTPFIAIIIICFIGTDNPLNWLSMEYRNNPSNVPVNQPFLHGILTNVSVLFALVSTLYLITKKYSLIAFIDLLGLINFDLETMKTEPFKSKLCLFQVEVILAFFGVLFGTELVLRLLKRLRNKTLKGYIEAVLVLCVFLACLTGLWAYFWGAEEVIEFRNDPFYIVDKVMEKVGPNETVLYTGRTQFNPALHICGRSSVYATEAELRYLGLGDDELFNRDMAVLNPNVEGFLPEEMPQFVVIDTATSPKEIEEAKWIKIAFDSRSYKLYKVI